MKTSQACQRSFAIATNAVKVPINPSPFIISSKSFVNAPSNTAKGTTDYFGYENQAEMYRLYRPRYPLDLLQDLSNKIPSAKSKRSLAIDIACGSGQLTQTLAKPFTIDAKSRDEFGFGFNKVIGIDTSQKQLDKAMEHASGDNIEYKLEDIECKISADDDSVDLITIAQGLHWFDIPKLLNEVKRVIKPEDGIFAVLGYGTPHFQQYEKFQEEFGKYYVNTLGSYNYGIDGKPCYWNIDRKLLDYGFEDKFMFVRAGDGEGSFDEDSFERQFFFENKWMNEQELFGYFQSMSGYNTYLERNGLKYGDEGDPMIHLRKVYREDMELYKQEKMMVVYPFFLLTMKK